MTTTIESGTAGDLKCRAATLRLHGLVAHFDELTEPQLPWLKTVLRWEELERQQRSLDRRLSTAHIGRFKPLADFDWTWPAQCDKGAVSELMTLDFITEAVNIVLVGPNGTGKSTIAQNIVHHAVMQGHSALFVNAARMLGELAACDGEGYGDSRVVVIAGGVDGAATAVRHVVVDVGVHHKEAIGIPERYDDVA